MTHLATLHPVAQVAGVLVEGLLVLALFAVWGFGACGMTLDGEGLRGPEPGTRNWSQRELQH